jgi:predicted chitinase
MGSAQSVLQLSHPVNPVLLCGSPMAAMMDIKPVANLAPFGLCKSLANPTVAAATAAAGGKLQEMPCIPCVTSPWAYGKMNVLVKGQPALTDDSRCVCMWLGIIKVKAAGQKSVIDTAPPFVIEDPQPTAAVTPAAPQTKDGDPKAAGTPTPQGSAPQTPKKGLLTSITDNVKASIKNALNKVKDRAADAASAVATAVQGYVTAILTTAGAAVAAVVGGIFGIRANRDDKEATVSQDAAAAETGTTGTPPNAVTKAKTEITARLIRNYFNDKRTFGAFEVFRGDESIFKCYTCEDTVRGDGNPDTVETWKIAKESAIPYGRYTCSFTYSNRFKRKMWLVEEVPGFSGIRIHRGKNESWTEGCILLGDSIAKNYTLLDNSEKTVEKFEKCMADYGNQNFELEITNESKPYRAQPKESKPNVTKPGKCFCNRDIGVDEFEEILRCLRMADGRKDVSLFTGKNCKIPSKDKTIARLTEEFNMTCKLYGIAHCIQKIHFLSQIYWESDHFNTTLEYASGAGYNPGQHNDAKDMDHTENGDGHRYKGRGLMQLTWRKNQMRYLKYAKDRFEILNGRTDADIEDRSNSFQEIISDTLSGSMDSAGWFWSLGNIIAYKKKADRERFEAILGKTLNVAALYADKYQEGISISVNGGGNGKSERKKYYDELKKIMSINQCTNKSKYHGGLS